MNPDFERIGKAFVEQYYKLFDGDRAELKVFYRDNSMLTFEGSQVQGVIQIMQKIMSLPFQTVQHVVTTCDCQPTTDYGVLVHVVGQLKDCGLIVIALTHQDNIVLDDCHTDNDRPHSFSQTFCLKRGDSVNANNYYCFNDIFRLSLHHG